MGGSMSKTTTRTLCESNNRKPEYDPPPVMQRPLSIEEKMWEKFKKEPLIPIGCAATAYFLVSGIKSFKNRDPRRAQKMMRARVGAQFATLAAFVGYMGLDNVNFDFAPNYYAAKAAEEKDSKRQDNGGK
jgi:hypothetical protein